MLSDTNLDSVGATLLFDYTNGFDPNFLVFSIFVTNQYVNTSSPVLPLILGGGSAFDMAVLVNDANLADAVWQPFNSNVVVNLNAGDGVYDVRVGLRKSPVNTDQVWKETYLILDTVPPLFVITNPMPGMVSQSPIQLQGYANEPLSGLTFDVSNVTGIFTNQTGYLTGVFYDDNLWVYTTNYFQCPDIGLGNGTNFIIVHATDLAGNTANVSLMLDYVPNNNSPVLNLIWPPDGAQISDNNFTVQAQTDDNTSTVMAVITDSNGNTNTVSGLVEQNGTIWVQNLPLAAGANQLTLTVANASGSSTTNLTVYQSSVLVTVAPLTSDQLNQTSITVAGTISELGDTVTVNGVPATVNPDGTWEADDVPVSAYGTAIIDVEVYAGNTSNFAHNNLRFTPLDSPSNGNSIGSHISNQLQPVAVKMASYFTHKSYAIMVVSIVPDFTVYQTVQVPVWWQGGIGIKFYSDDDTVNWAAGVGGTKHDYGYSDDNPGNFDGWQEFGPDQGGVGSAPGWSGWESADDSGTYSGDSTGTWSKTVRTRVVIAPAGQQAAGQTNSYLVLASALEVADGWDSGNGVIPLPPEWLQIDGQTLINSGITNADGSVSGAVIVQVLAGTTTNVTPVATQLYGYNDYIFNVQVTNVAFQLTVVSNSATQIDATNWAVIKSPTNDYVIVQATLNYTNDWILTNAAKAIQWTGGEAVPGNLLQRRVTKTNSVETTVTASLGSSITNLNVWVIWGTMQFLTNGNNPSPLSFVNYGFPDNQLGIQYYDHTSSGTYLAATLNYTNMVAGKICAIATITPSGIQSIITNGWDFVQKAEYTIFTNGSIASGISSLSWTNDGPADIDGNKTIRLDTSNKLYSIDGPSLDLFKQSLDSAEHYAVFYDYVTWKSEICCDTNNFWCFQARWKTDQLPQFTFISFGVGAITIPTSSFYLPP